MIEGGGDHAHTSMFSAVISRPAASSSAMMPITLPSSALTAALTSGHRAAVGDLRNEAVEVAEDVQKPTCLLRVFPRRSIDQRHAAI